MTEHGFIHDQGSGYISKESLTRLETLSFLVTLIDRNPWLHQCCKRLRISKVAEDILNGEAHGDLLQSLNKLVTSGQRKRSIKRKSPRENTTDGKPKPPSFAEIAEQYKDYKPQPKPRSSGNGNDKKPPNRGNSGR